MASNATRSQIVNDALLLAGRSTELKSSANGWLNYFLRHVGITFRFPELRKIGATQTLALGSNTATLPADLGAGMEKQGMIFGTDNKPLEEKSSEDFAYNNGYQSITQAGSGRPLMYVVDREANLFRFNVSADQAYTFFPIYFKTPPLPATDASGDNSTIWIDNDLLAVEGLMWMIYKFMGDPREEAQEARWIRLVNDWKRELPKMGGTSRIMPSPSRFKRVNFNEFGM